MNPFKLGICLTPNYNFMHSILSLGGSFTNYFDTILGISLITYLPQVDIGVEGILFSEEQKKICISLIFPLQPTYLVFST